MPVHLLVVVNGSKIDTKGFASLNVGVCKTDKIGLKDGQPSKHFLWTLQKPHIIPGLVAAGFRCLCQQAIYKFYRCAFVNW